MWVNDNGNSDYDLEDLSSEKSSTTKLGDNGLLVEVYVDKDASTEVTVVMIGTYLAQADSDYDEDNETLEVSMVSDGDGDITLGNTTLSSDDIDGLAQFCLLYTSCSPA